MGYITLDSIIRSAIADKGRSTLHYYVPYLHWAAKGLEKFASEGVYTELRVIKDHLDENGAFPFPEDMKMWNKLGVVHNGKIHAFVNNDTLSLYPKDHTADENDVARGLFSYHSDIMDVLYTTNIYVATSTGVVEVGQDRRTTFRVNWEAKKFQVSKFYGSEDIYLEYIRTTHDPTTETMVNEVAKEYIENFIFFREARFKFGASHRETMGAERLWLESQDDLAAELSDLTAMGLMRALTDSTRRSIDQ